MRWCRRVGLHRYDGNNVSRLRAGEQYAYVFDLGDNWAHLCTVAAERIDPLDQLGIVPDVPLPYWGWGEIPDQCGRRWDGDDGEARPPKRPAQPLRPSAVASREAYRLKIAVEVAFVVSRRCWWFQGGRSGGSGQSPDGAISGRLVAGGVAALQGEVVAG